MERAKGEGTEGSRWFGEEQAWKWMDKGACFHVKQFLVLTFV